MKSSSFLTSYVNFLRTEKRRSLFGFGCANIKTENAAKEEGRHVIGFIRFSSTGQHLGDGQRDFFQKDTAGLSGNHFVDPDRLCRGGGAAVVRRM